MAGEPTGAERAAILLLSLGEQEAAQVLKHMEPGEVQKVGAAMAALKGVSRDQMSKALESFITVAESKGMGSGGTHDYLRRVLTNSVGKQKADMLMQRIETGSSPGAGIESLKWMDAKTIAQVIGLEHPQIVAIVLSHLEPDQAGGVLELLPEQLRGDVVLRIATLDEVPQAALNELDQLVERQAGVTPQAPPRRIGGAKVAAGIVKSVAPASSAQLLETIQQADQELHQKIKDLMFTFDHLLTVDDRGIQALLREVSSDQLTLALRGAEPAMQDKIFRNMSKRAAEILRDDMEARGPVKLAEVEAAQKEIVAVAQRLAEEGTINIGGGSGDYV